jgi:hypothetical protein
MRLGICSLLLLVSSTTFAQFKNIKLGDEAIINRGCGPSISVNKRNPANIVAASATDVIYYTMDGGATWQSTKLTSSDGILGSSMLVSDDKGNLYSFHLSGAGDLKNDKSLDQIFCHISRDGGKTWEEGASVGLNAKDHVRPAATVDGKGNVWVAWTQYDQYGNQDGNCQSVVLLSTSANGKKWSKPIPISQTPGNCKDDDDTAQGAVPAIGSDGKAFLTWSNQSKIFLDRSFANGLWLTNDIAVGQQPGGWDMKVPGHARVASSPVLVIDQSKSPYQNSLYLVWSDQRNGENDSDVWFMRSTNYGDNWSTPVRLGDTSNKRHQYMPWMTVDPATGYIYIIYYDRSAYEDDQTDVYLTYSTDGGISFKSAKVSETPFVPIDNVLFSDYNFIVAQNGVIATIWTRIDEGKPAIWTAIIKQSDIIQPPQASSKKKKKKD